VGKLTSGNMHASLPFGLPTFPRREFPAVGRHRPPLTVDQILSWADQHKARTGRLPRVLSGAVVGAAGETWHNIDEALRSGRRGLEGGDSLPRLLSRERGQPRYHGRPLTEAQILRWAKHHHRTTGYWPKRDSGPVPAAPAESWRAIDHALREGSRGLEGGSSLKALLDRHLRQSPRPGPVKRGGPPDVVRRRLAQKLRAQGLSLAEIGERMDCSKQNVFQLLHPGRRKKEEKR
jgi:hypothetical protein